MRADRGLAVAVMLAAAITFAGCSPGSMQADIPYIRLKAASAADGGIKAFAKGDYGRALDRFKEALRIERAIDDRPGEVRALINLGRVFTALGHLESAELYLNDGVTLAGTLKGEERLSAEALSTLAKVEYLRGRQQASLDDIEKALSLDSRLGIASGERLNLKGVIYARAGRLGEAKEALNSALLLNIREKDAVEAANSYRTMAEIKEAEADLPGAMSLEKQRLTSTAWPGYIWQEGALMRRCSFLRGLIS
ncbi:MAG: tetratricopeptide repeat protein [Deltaproteobacteria bacterium]|nr:tetratricopeptide repeat protein [Deltaproteobacteria bacterium]